MASSRQPRTVAQKMGVKPDVRAHLLAAPPDTVAAMSLPHLDLTQTLRDTFDYLHLFVTRQDALREQFGELRDRLRPGGMLWISWPKGGKLGTRGRGTTEQWLAVGTVTFLDPRSKKQRLTRGVTASQSARRRVARPDR